MKVTKAVLPVAGLGTRFLPATKSIAKEMITVVDKPVIQYVVEEAVAAGIKEIILVTHSSKRAIEDHFDTHVELEAQLRSRGKDKLLASITNIIPDDVRIIAVRQGRPLGLGHAVLCAREVVGDEPFAVLLPDVLVDNGDGVTDLGNMMARYQATGHAQIMVAPVPMENVHQYGVVALAGEEPVAAASAAITGLVEKPAAHQAPSNLSVVGRYILPPSIFPLLATTQPGAGDEIQLTDGIASLLHQAGIEAYRMAGVTYDCGSKIGYLRATLAYGVRHPDIGEEFAALLKQVQ